MTLLVSTINEDQVQLLLMAMQALSLSYEIKMVSSELIFYVDKDRLDNGTDLFIIVRSITPFLLQM